MKYILGIISVIILVTACNESEIPTINIVKANGFGWDSKEPCKIGYDEGDGEVVLEAKIKFRGGMSSRYNKHSFALELETKHGLCGLPSDDDWILNANYVDKTFMRHKVSFDLFRQMSPRNIASRCAYVKVRINNEYEGLYVLMEEINGAMLGLNKKDDGAVLFKDPPVFFKDRLPNVQDTVNYYQQKFPKFKKKNRSYYMEGFHHFLFNASDTEFTKNISAWVDINSVLDWHIIFLFANNSDGIMKNFFLYKLDANTPFRFAIWDYDHSFGRDGDNERNKAEKELNAKRSILLKRLLELPETGYTDRLKQRWIELRDADILSTNNFEKLIDQMDNVIHQEVDSNFVKWPVDSKWYFDNNHYQQEVDIMLQFVNRRIGELDIYIDQL